MARFVVPVEMVVEAESEEAARRDVEGRLKEAYNELAPMEWSIRKVEWIPDE